MEHSKIPLQKWGYAIYLCVISPKSVSSMQLHRDLKITQKSAWFMVHRLQEAMEFSQGPVEVDETFMGGQRKNMSNVKRKALRDTLQDAGLSE